MLAQEIIRAKRDGQALNEAQIQNFVDGLTHNTWSEGQVAALGMAVFLKGMGRDEAVLLTRAMMNSGRVMRWPDMPGPVLDKHSSGGVGDKVSLMLAPMVAACGGYVPMIAGRGLGHTGGTVDKLEAIPGYTTTPDPAKFDQIVRSLGCAIIGQTADLAPADKRFYATRDVTATVESVPLITASILSKKLAAGLEGLAMDIKCGNGAFASTPEFAKELAESIVAVAGGAGLKTRALITDMNQILGTDVGNALEVIETIRYLKGEHREPRLHEVTLALCAEMLVLGGLAANTAAARVKLQASLDSGAAAEKFAQMVAALGGPKDLMERPDAYLTAAPVVKPVPAPRDGVITTMSTRDLGVAIVELGGGRRKAGDAIDMRVGFSEVLPLGTRVTAGQPLALIHAADDAAADRAIGAYLAACTLDEADVAATPMVMATIG
ncbi:thymidine phosphorylase [Roseateles asaccharophilus]|uniref:Thymidine phosphorylase n=1 Tax=Roseateles asaccharophilus TaxID=582607 RepID=A0ABU2AA81_9BURK|nr:thymidine phosphorylase [Roseateles asaccharophilus]MDR7334106.1 thymidine phosphorylase [Roseateles asaccharophilus]